MDVGGNEYISVATDLLARFPGLSIIACHGFGFDFFRQQLPVIPRLAFLLKPVKRSALKQVVDSLLTGGAGRGQREDRRPLREEGRQDFSDARILLVEDNEINQMVARDIISRTGASVVTAENGRVALSLADGKFDLVLMDIQMPEMDGYETANALRAKEDMRDIPIIAMTAGVFEDDRQRCLNAGMNDFLLKPVTPEGLTSILKKWLRKPADMEAGLQEISSGREVSEGQPVWDGDIQGIDVDDVDKRFQGNMELFLDALGKFVSRYGNFRNEVSQKLKSGQHEEVLDLIHSLKGVAANLSATGVYAGCIAMEAPIREGRMEHAMELLDEVQDSIDAISISFTRISKGSKDVAWEEKQQAGSEVDQAFQTETSSLLYRLDEFLALDDIDAEVLWNQLRTLIAGKVPSELITKMDLAMQDLDFEAAREHLHAIRDVIKNRGHYPF